MADFRFDGIENLAECIPRQPVTAWVGGAAIALVTPCSTPTSGLLANRSAGGPSSETHPRTLPIQTKLRWRHRLP